MSEHNTGPSECAGGTPPPPSAPASEPRPDSWIDVLRSLTGPWRTAAQKRAAVKVALEHPKLSQWSNRRLSAHLGVDPSWLGRLRRELNGTAPDPKKAASAKARYTKRMGEG